MLLEYLPISGDIEIYSFYDDVLRSKISYKKSAETAGNAV